jgi:hypothetical protein
MITSTMGARLGTTSAAGARGFIPAPPVPAGIRGEDNVADLRQAARPQHDLDVLVHDLRSARITQRSFWLPRAARAARSVSSRRMSSASSTRSTMRSPSQSATTYSASSSPPLARRTVIVARGPSSADSTLRAASAQGRSTG